MRLDHIDWSIDPDWTNLVVGQTKHAGHHIGQDAEGTWFCRECSTSRLYLIPQSEVDRMLLVSRKKETVAMIQTRVYYRDNGNLCDIVQFADPIKMLNYLHGFYRNSDVYRWSISAVQS